jgi:putative transposase
LQQYSQHYALRILGYCLMTNHVHLVVLPLQETALARTLREVHGRYARYRNAIERSSGHVWQNRYYSCAIDGVRLAGVMRYVELNPVRAGLVRVAEDFAWSSALIHLGGADRAGLLDLEAWRRTWTPEAWASLLREGEDHATAIREATHSGRVLGGEGFVAELERRLQRRIAPGKAGRPKNEVGNRAAG